MTDPRAAEDLAAALNAFTELTRSTVRGPQIPLEDRPTDTVVALIATTHRLHITAGRFVDDLLAAARDRRRPDRPSLRELGHLMGLHHTTIDERIRRSAGPTS
jgi:hypothetical protein